MKKNYKKGGKYLKINDDQQLQKMVEFLEDEKAEDIVLLDVKGLTVIADYFLIASGRSTVHLQQMAESIEEQLKEEGIYALRKEGHKEGKWIVVDFGICVLHIFRHEERQYYKLEDLWGDARQLISR